MTTLSPTNRIYHFRSHQNRVKAITSPTIRRKYKGSIYIIWHVETNERYVGKTSAAFASRMYSHVYYANHPEKLAGQRKLARALRRSPSKFRFSVLKRNINKYELSDWERKFIATYKPSLNMAGGGGGGVSSSEDESNGDEKVEIFTTPKKKYPVRLRKGRVKVILTPTARNQRNVVYVFKNRRNGKRLVGRTGQFVNRRVYQYHWVINSKKSDQKHRKFVQDIKNNPQDFNFGILAKSSSSLNLDELEEQCIQNKDSRKNGYNKNRGGGGSSVCRRLFFS